MASVRKLAALLLFVFFIVLAGAAVTIRNITEWRIVARASPVVKLENGSLLPVLTASWRVLDGLNVTTYRLCFVPGWEENYTVGALDTRIPDLPVFLCREDQMGAASYWISLDGVLQVSHAQACGAPVQLPASLSWRSIASSEYWVLATARFTVGGAKVQQFINFSAKPMSLLSSASYSCTQYTRSDDFSGACVPTQYTFDTSIPNNRTYVSGGSTVILDAGTGNPKPSLHTLSQSGYASFFIDHSTHPFSATTGFAFQYLLSGSVRDDDYMQVHFFIDLSGDTVPDLEVIYYGSGGGTTPFAMASIIYGFSLPTAVRTLPGFRTDQNVWISISIAQVYATGRVVGLAFTVYSRRGLLKVWWDNVGFSRCVPPSYLAAYTRGNEHTLVYVDAVRSPSTPPSVATEVDAYGGTGNPAVDYGVAAAVYDVRRWGSIPAGGFSFSVRGLYVRNATDARNNLAYVSVGVDSNSDGLMDAEYFFYRFDVATGTLGIIVSVHVNPGQVVCTVGSGGSCTPSSPNFTVLNLGTMESGAAYTWSGSLPSGLKGLVVRAAFVAVDASGYASCTSDDFWVWWDDFVITFYACTQLPPDWSASDSIIYRGTVPGSIVYAGRFEGDGGFYVFDSSLNPLFGVRRSGQTYYARCGQTEYLLGSYLQAWWVDLRPLEGVWEVILRDFYGGVLTRRACSPTAAPSYVGFTGVASFEFTAWGCNE